MQHVRDTSVTHHQNHNMIRTLCGYFTPFHVLLHTNSEDSAQHLAGECRVLLRSGQEGVHNLSLQLILINGRMILLDLLQHGHPQLMDSTVTA
jgi:hypothetical protein